MNSFKKTAIAFLLASSVATSCHTTTYEDSGDVSVRFYKDQVTGVEYVLYYGGYGCSITPRLNSDGTPYTGKKEE